MSNSTTLLSAPAVRGRRIGGVLLIVAGFLLLLNGWTAHSGAAAAERFVARLTARADARVVARLWQIEPAPFDEDAATPPRRQARARLGVRLALTAGDGRPATVELRATGEAVGVDGWPWGGPLPLELELGLSPADPATGLPRVELVAPPSWLVAMRERPARAWPLVAVAGGAIPAAGSELEALRLEVDRPLEALARLWMRPEGNRPIRLHVDPRDPATALPGVSLGSGWAQRFLWSTSLLIAGGGFGAAFLFVGLRRLAPRVGWGVRMLATAGLTLATPLWAPRVDSGLGERGPFHRLVHFAGDDASWSARGPVRLATRDELTDEVWVVDFPSSRYAGALALFHFTRPTAVARTPDAAWRAVVDQIAEQTRALDDTALVALLRELNGELAGNRREVAPAFLSAAGDLAGDPARAAGVRAAARQMLVLALDPANAPRSGEFAAREKLADAAALAAHPDPAIAAAALAVRTSSVAAPGSR